MDLRTINWTVSDALYNIASQACLGPTREDRALIPGSEARCWKCGEKGHPRASITVLKKLDWPLYQELQSVKLSKEEYDKSAQKVVRIADPPPRVEITIRVDIEAYHKHEPNAGVYTD